MMEIARWTQLLSKLRINHDGDTYQQLISAYSEKHRAYHTAEHIEGCLANFDSSVALLENPDAVEMAIWFHDVIYRPYSKKNEEDSAVWAADFLTAAGASVELVTEVSQLIIATKHDVPINTHDQSVLVDIDLVILGSDPSTYSRFEDDVRAEYRYVPKFIFKKKRVELLRGLLGRQTIYLNESFSKLYETRARFNMESAVERLLR